MDWIKVKVQHILFTALTPSEKGMLIMIQALTAHLERVPSEKEIIALPGVSKKAYKKLSESLCNINVDLSEVLRKVIEDVSDVARKRSLSKERQRKSRSKSKDVTRDVTVTSHKLPIRAEKIREDNIIKEKEEASFKEKQDLSSSLANSQDNILIKNLKEINMPQNDFEIVLDQIIELRHKKKPIENKVSFRAMLISAFLKNNNELQVWYCQIKEADKLIQKKKKEQLALDELLDKEKRKEAVIDRERVENERLMDSFNKFSSQKRESIIKQAERDIKKVNPLMTKLDTNSPFMQSFICQILREKEGVYASS